MGARGPKPRVLSESEKAAAAQRYRDGWSYRRIQRELGINKRHMPDILEEFGVTPRHGGTNAETKRNAEIRDLHEAGYSYEQIANHFGLSRQRVHQICSRSRAGGNGRPDAAGHAATHSGAA